MIANKILENQVFTTEDARKMGLSARMLHYYVEKGLIKKLGKGVFCGNQISDQKDPQWQEMATAAVAIKGAVVCLVSALCYYEMTDSFMDRIWLAVPNSYSKAHWPNTKIIRMRHLDFGVDEQVIAGINIKIFDKERTIIDSFRLLDQETALKALKAYFTNGTKRPNVRRLSEYAKRLRFNIAPYLAVMLTE